MAVLSFSRMGHAGTMLTNGSEELVVVPFGAMRTPCISPSHSLGEQTNQRAELLAALKVCESDPRALEIRSDSAYVCRGFHAASSWRLQMNRPNSDLWVRVERETIE